MLPGREESLMAHKPKEPLIQDAGRWPDLEPDQEAELLARLPPEEAEAFRPILVLLREAEAARLEYLATVQQAFPSEIARVNAVVAALDTYNAVASRASKAIAVLADQIRRSGMLNGESRQSRFLKPGGTPKRPSVASSGSRPKR
jgi:hypothetical protein